VQAGKAISEEKLVAEAKLRMRTVETETNVNLAAAEQSEKLHIGVGEIRKRMGESFETTRKDQALLYVKQEEFGTKDLAKSPFIQGLYMNSIQSEAICSFDGIDKSRERFETVSGTVMDTALKDFHHRTIPS